MLIDGLDLLDDFLDRRRADLGLKPAVRRRPVLRSERMCALFALGFMGFVASQAQRSRPRSPQGHLQLGP